jgi:hypothetical protein
MSVPKQRCSSGAIFEKKESVKKIPVEDFVSFQEY